MDAFFDAVASPNIQTFIEPGSGAVTCVSISDQLLDVSWGTSGGAESGPGTFHVARVTVRDGAAVAWAAWGAQTNVGGEPIVPVEVWGSNVDLPEPATLGLLLMGSLTLLRRRRM